MKEIRILAFFTTPAHRSYCNSHTPVTMSTILRLLHNIVNFAYECFRFVHEKIFMRDEFLPYIFFREQRSVLSFDYLQIFLILQNFIAV